MTDNDSIKALKCCIELFYDNNVWCDQTIEGLADDVKYIFDDLINRKQAEIERLNKEVDRLSQVVLYNDGVTEMKITEAVKEFAEILKGDAVGWLEITVDDIEEAKRKVLNRND